MVTFEIKLWLGLLNQVDILGWAPPEKAENTFNYIEIVEEYIQDVVKQCIRQFRSAQIRYFLWLILHTFGNIFLTSFFKLAYFAKFKFWATRMQETPKEPLITFD